MRTGQQHMGRAKMTAGKALGALMAGVLLLASASAFAAAPVLEDKTFNVGSLAPRMCQFQAPTGCHGVVVSGPSHGTFNTYSNGWCEYTAAAGYYGTDSVTWKVTDGTNESNVAACTFIMGHAPALVSGPSLLTSPITGTTAKMRVAVTDDANGTDVTISYGQASGAPVIQEDISYVQDSASTAGSATTFDHTLTFIKAGTYKLRCHYTNPFGFLSYADFTLNVLQTVTNLSIVPANTSVSIGGTRQFSLTGTDQFGYPLASLPAITWSVSGGGTINASGLFTAGSTPGGPYTVTASCGGQTATANMTVLPPVPPAGTLRLASSSCWATERSRDVNRNLPALGQSIPAHYADISVLREGGSSGPVSVAYLVTSGSGTAGADCTPTSGTLSWANGDAAPKTFRISIVDDDELEGLETVNVQLVNPAGGALLASPDVATIDIWDDEVGYINRTIAFDEKIATYANRPAGSALRLSLRYYDPNDPQCTYQGSQRHFVIIDQPFHGTVEPFNTDTDADCMYYVTPGYVGPDSFTWRVELPNGISRVATVFIDVKASINEVPPFIPLEDSLTLKSGETKNYWVSNLSVSNSITGWNGANWPYTLVSGPSHGILAHPAYEVWPGNNVDVTCWKYTSDAGFVGTDTFTWRRQNGTNVSDTCVTTVYVTRANNQAPTIAVAAAASPNPVTGTSTAISILGADDGGEANLTYQWYEYNTSVNPVATNAAKNQTVTFKKTGTYNYRCVITDSEGAQQDYLAAGASCTVTVQQTLASVAVTPATASVASGATQQFAATAFDQFGDALDTQPAITWTVSGGGTISAGGLFTAGSQPGVHTVTASSGGISGTATVAVTSGANQAPVIAVVPAANLNSTTWTAALSVLGADDTGEANLTYTWSVVGTPVAPVTFSVNGSNSAKNSTASFIKGGSYTLKVTIKDLGGLTVSGTIVAAPEPVLASIALAPANASVAEGGTVQFSAVGIDQFGKPLVAQPGYAWTVSGGGTIDTNGLFAAGAAAGTYTVTATSGGKHASVNVRVGAGGNWPPEIISGVTASPNPALAGETLTFSVAASDPDNDPLNYAWSFGDGTAGSGTAPAHAYSAAGRYTAEVTVTDGKGGTVSANIVVVVNGLNGTLYTLAVNTTGTGTGRVTLNPAGGSYTAGTVVTLTATPAAGSAFSSWSGALTGSTSSAQITMDTDKTVVAEFTALPPNGYALAVSTAGTGSGTVTLNPAGGSYTAGTVVTLTATPAAGSTFSRWLGPLTGATNQAQVTMDANKSVIALFALDSGTPGTPSTPDIWEALTVTQIQLRRNARKANADQILVWGLLAVPANFAPAGQSVLMNVAGVQQNFVLDAKGRAASGLSKFKLQAKKKSKTIFAQLAPFQCQLAGCDLSAFAPEGWIKGQAMPLDLYLTFNGTGYSAQKNLMGLNPVKLFFKGK